MCLSLSLLYIYPPTTGPSKTRTSFILAQLRRKTEMGVLEIRKKVAPSMGRKDLLCLFSFTKTQPSQSSPSSPSYSASQGFPPSPLCSFSQRLMDETIENAKALIMKWDSNVSPEMKPTSLFGENQKEAKEFIKCIQDLHRAMHFPILQKSDSAKLVLAQNLMQIAMNRLKVEFYHILTVNRQYLDPESVSIGSAHSHKLSSSEDEDCARSEEEILTTSESILKVERLSELAMSYLKLIADCMISSGYGGECLKIYKIIRRSVIDEELYHLGIQRYSSSVINRMTSEVLEQSVKNWLRVIKVSIETLFHSERFLCDHVFSASGTIRESCFTDITTGAINLFKFPELVAKGKRSPERIFLLMDLYDSISSLWPEIESIFSFKSTSAVKQQALNSLHKLGNSVRIILSEFELSIRKNPKKSPVLGGGIHPLTNAVMTYMPLLTSYNRVLSDILADSASLTQLLPPESQFGIPKAKNSEIPAVSAQLAQIILVLLCKLDREADLYSDIALSYLFLVNNLQFIIERVRVPGLMHLLGDEWIASHEKKMKHYVKNYERVAWTKVYSSLPENPMDAIPPESVRRYFRQFSLAFYEAYRKQTSWVIPDRKLRDEIKASIANKLMPPYRKFYDAHLAALSGEENLEVLVRFAPENLENYLSDLFVGTTISESLSSLSPSTSHSHVASCLS